MNQDSPYLVNSDIMKPKALNSAYEPPKLMKLGSVVEFTQSCTFGVTSDLGAAPANRCTKPCSPKKCHD